jgi:hypothetical protein
MNRVGPEFAFFGIFFLIMVVGWLVTIVALVDAIPVSSDAMYRAGTKLIWVLVILLLNFLGAIVYFVVGRPTKNPTTGGWLPPPPPGSL